MQNSHEFENTKPREKPQTIHGLSVAYCTKKKKERQKRSQKIYKTVEEHVMDSDALRCQMSPR